MDIKNTIISAKVVIESLVALLENEDVDISSIKFKVGSQEEGYESEDMSFESLINLTMKGLEEAKAQAVQEWAVIVPKLSANYLFNTVPDLGFKQQDLKDTVLYHLNYMALEFRDSAKQFVEDDHTKQKAIIEAQEQKG